MGRRHLDPKERNKLAESLRSLGEALQQLPKTHEWHFVENGNLTGCRRLLFSAIYEIENQRDAEATDDLYWSLQNLLRYEPNCDRQIKLFLIRLQARSQLEEAIKQLNPPQQLTLF